MQVNKNSVHKMNVICNIQNMQKRIGSKQSNVKVLSSWPIGSLEEKRNKLIKKYNNHLAKQ